MFHQVFTDGSYVVPMAPAGLRRIYDGDEAPTPAGGLLARAAVTQGLDHALIIIRPPSAEAAEGAHTGTLPDHPH